MLGLVVVCFILQVAFVRNVQITTPSGELLGSSLTTRLGKTIYSFRGIRFAEPPVGELRFKPPVPTGRWSGVYNATSDGAACPQPKNGSITTPMYIDEDCLFLNVYTTKLPNATEPVRRPVIFYIFPGGFFLGSGNSDVAGPQYLMDQDIVLVTLNYRLAALGFIAVGREAPGNNGIKDQVVAMRWVKRNIEAFGGDPNSITLAGHSAGAESISLHLVSPMSRNLFHKAILGGSSFYGPYPLVSEQTELARKLARFVECPDDTPANILRCLKTKPAQELADTLPRFKEFGDDPPMIWSPVIEEDYGQERFLTEHPIKAIVEGNFTKVPVMAGITKDELGNNAIKITTNLDLTVRLNLNWEKYAPIIFCYERDTNRSRYVSRALRKFYFNNLPISIFSTSALSRLYADSLTGFGVNRAVELLSKKSSKPVYYSLFTVSLFGVFGPFHAEDYAYLLKISQLELFTNITNLPDPKVIGTLTSLWASFAKTSNPTAYPNATIEWKTYNVATKRYLDIGKRLVMRDHLFEDRYAFWRKLYPISGYL